MTFSSEFGFRIRVKGLDMFSHLRADPFDVLQRLGQPEVARGGTVRAQRVNDEQAAAPHELEGLLRDGAHVADVAHVPKLRPVG